MISKDSKRENGGAEMRTTPQHAPPCAWAMGNGRWASDAAHLHEPLLFATREPNVRGGQECPRSGVSRKGGFTLVELLVVIAIIGMLAGMILYLGPAISAMKTRKLVQAQLEQLTTMIEAYKEAKGFYPPENPKNNQASGYWMTSLYYELTGSYLDTNVTRTLFGLGGIINSVSGGVQVDDGTAAKPKNYFASIKENQYMTNNGVNILGIKASAPPPFNAAPFNGFCPWQYRVAPAGLDANTVSDLHNQHSYDLWIVVNVNGAPTTFGNWKEKE